MCQNGSATTKRLIILVWTIDTEANNGSDSTIGFAIESMLISKYSIN